MMHRILLRFGLGYDEVYEYLGLIKTYRLNNVVAVAVVVFDNMNKRKMYIQQRPYKLNEMMAFLVMILN